MNDQNIFYVLLAFDAFDANPDPALGGENLLQPKTRDVSISSAFTEGE
jgi:hypothetical protein